MKKNGRDYEGGGAGQKKGGFRIGSRLGGRDCTRGSHEDAEGEAERRRINTEKRMGLPT